ncbi:hypothetical protein M0805_007333 [Coniferiporia weirii]|nr:hypothetical protein M0805_007333 [Coniferiporia weirii]
MANSPSPLGFASAFDTSRPGPSLRQNTNTIQRAASNLDSPTSTISSAPTRMPLRTNPANSAFSTPTKRTIIRVDPTLVSCLDPADKELYDLWVPKQ